MQNFKALALSGLLLLGSLPATAAVQTFGPQMQKFTVDVPEGWQAVTREAGVQLIDPDGDNSVDVQINQNPQHMEMRQIVDTVAANLANSSIEESDGFYVVKAEVDGTRLAVMLYGDDKRYVAVTLAGDDAEVLSRIVSSIDFPQP